MFQKLLYPRQALLVSSCHREKANLAATNWATPASLQPPMLALSLPNNSLTFELVSRSKEFVVAVPHEGMRDALLLCSSTSGRYIDKFAETKLTQQKADLVSPPLIAEALANIECRVNNILNCGSSSLVVGEVLRVHFPDDERLRQRLLFDNGEKELAALELAALPPTPKAEQKTEKATTEQKAENNQQKAEKTAAAQAAENGSQKTETDKGAAAQKQQAENESK